MSSLDWPALLLGLLLGLAINSLFFWGLNFGIQRALDAQNPAGILLVSFLLRMALLLGIGFALAALSASLWPLIGYVLTFFVVRWQAIRRARVTAAVR
ncbi:N-ATPase subunit AtpR [Oceanisphaera sp. W20_SRM_FM3]|uniref:N-ATPase subunit AtpR n=1 Tax=Oceanisphaera sp. W20_SRM_FM3 TaxID=3240267 RepID=UPI003F9946A1